jgi:exopolysaccharide biosynthesis WecB/TagA/CpsF family protein
MIPPPQKAAQIPRSLLLLGIPFHDVTMAETLDAVGRFVKERRPAYLATANLDFATQASKDSELHQILLEADLVLCDGTPIRWLSHLTGRPLREKVSGSDLIPKLATRAAAEGWRLFLLGGDPDSLDRAEKKLTGDNPGLIIAGSYSPPFAPLDQMDHEEISGRIKEASPDLLLVAFGCPKQEKWIHRHYRDLGVPCSIGIGATIDFLAGKVMRAPGWISALGLEWVIRLIQEPRRLGRRYLEDFIFLLTQTYADRNTLLRDRKKNLCVKSVINTEMP